jgi:hypothetical protein
MPSILNLLSPTPNNPILLSANLSTLDQILFERLSLKGLNIYQTLFGIIHRANLCLMKTWNQTPSRSQILKEIRDISENYLTTAFTMPDMFPDGVISLESADFETMNEVLTGKKVIRCKVLMTKLRSETYSKETIRVALDFLKLINKIESPQICQNLFNSCCENNQNFSLGKI